MKILTFGIYSKRPEYPRFRNLIEGLEKNRAEVIECHFAMADSFRQRIKSSQSLGGKINYLLHLAVSYLSLAFQFFKAPRVDAILVGYPGYFHVRFARLLRVMKNRKAILIYDVFFSLYDTLVEDRGLLKKKSIAARLVHALERDACRAADICLIDTNAHGDHISEEFSVPREKVKRLFVGPSFPRSGSPPPADRERKNFQVLFIGTFIPLHGIDTILGAAEKLRENEEVVFTLVGTGQLRREMENKARASHLTNVHFVDWVDPGRLPELLGSCDLALGIFGTTKKASRVIPIKVFDVCAAGIPFITADTKAIREVFNHTENAWLIPPGDSKALAKAVLQLKERRELREKMAEGSHRLAATAFSVEEIGRELMSLIEDRNPGDAEA